MHPNAVGSAWERRMRFGPNPDENEVLRAIGRKAHAAEKGEKLRPGGVRGAAGVALIDTLILCYDKAITFSFHVPFSLCILMRRTEETNLKYLVSMRFTFSLSW